MTITEIRIESLGELIDQITPSPDAELGRRRDRGIYHGAEDAALPLLTSLDRLGGTNPPHTKVELEPHILRNFIRYSRPYVSTTIPNDWELLVMAQHYGVPTRLLDWTYSPLVAAFFATRPQYRHNAAAHASPDIARAIWRLEWHRVHEYFGLEQLALRIEDLDVFRDSDGKFTPWELFDAQRPSDPFLCVIEPPSLTERIVAQAGVFTLCSSVTEPLEQFLSDHHLEGSLTKFVIPPEKVSEIRDQLDLAGIDERRMFPGLDGVAAALRRYYT